MGTHDELLKFMVETNSEQIETMRDKMEEFNKTMITLSHTLETLKTNINGFDEYQKKLEKANDEKFKKLEEKVCDLESQQKYMGFIHRVMCNKWFWILVLFLMFCVDKNDITQTWHFLINRY